MNVYAISDLHMSGASNKPMNIFGDGWDGHIQKIKDSWNRLVKDEDVVLIAGDISWAMKLDEAISDISALAPLKGKKVFCRGNHDYWWNGITRLRESAPRRVFYISSERLRKNRKSYYRGFEGLDVPRQRGLFRAGF